MGTTECMQYWCWGCAKMAAEKKYGKYEWETKLK